jgi:serine phosphatase RsbU (regulator of sigma subunit)
MKPRNSSSLIEWAVSQRALPGQSVSGDLHLVEPHAGGVLLAVVDGIGHGPEATYAADIAVAIMRDRPQDSVHSLVNRCHAALSRTRGVVLTLVSLDAADHTITWCGVGNVEGLLLRADPRAQPPHESVLLRGGLVGAQLPVLYANVVPINRGDLLVLASDGIRPDFEQDVIVKSPPQRIADHILQKYFKGTDDALVLAVRYLGSSHG